MKRAVLVDSVRTGITRSFKGSLRETRPDDLAAHCVDQLLARNPRVDPERVADCVVGCAFPEGAQGMNIGRSVALLSRLGAAVAGTTMNRYCASGLQAIAYAAAQIASGHADAMVAGGVESISMTLSTVNTNHVFNRRLSDRHPGVYLGMDIDNPQIEYRKRVFQSMGETAELVAERFGISRRDQDVYSVRSQERTARAQASGLFDDEIIPVEVITTSGDERGEVVVRKKVVTRDECNRPATTLEQLAEFKPSFKPGGSVTAGNSSQVTDGACFCLLVSEDLARDRALEHLGYFRGFTVAGCPPEVMGVGPVPAIRELTRRVDVSPSEIDLFEINEAFASQTVHCQRVLEIDDQRLNVNGGAISIGHPFGMSGARMVGHLLRELRRRNGRFGVVSMCVGGGMGAAGLVESEGALRA